MVRVFYLSLLMNLFLFQQSLRISTGRSRAPIPFDTSSDHPGSKGDQSMHSNESMFVSHMTVDLHGATTGATNSHEMNVRDMSDDEVRERFKAMIVSDDQRMMKKSKRMKF